MIKIIKVRTKKERKLFIEFPLKLYKNCKYFVPPLYADEMAMFTEKNVYHKTCKSEFFLAIKDYEVVGRIQAIIQKQHNEIHSQKRVRFTRFDSINDQSVANALFSAVETWAREEGMDTICGPLGYSDLEREGLLIDGFDKLSTFEEQYNYDYYEKLISSQGYQKEVDWVEWQIRLPDTPNEKLKRVAEHALKLSNLHLADAKLSKAKFIKKYKDGIFDCLDECYKELYGVVPFTEEMKKQMIDNFMLIVKKELVLVVLDENEKVVAFALAFPSIAEALVGTSGKLTPLTLFKLLRAIKSPKVIDLALIGVLPKYQAKGINAVALQGLADMLSLGKVTYCESNLNLEDNSKVQSQWKYFNAINHKRRRSFFKGL